MSKYAYTDVCFACGRSFQRPPTQYCHNTIHDEVRARYVKEQRQEKNRSYYQTRQMDLPEIPRIAKAPKITPHAGLPDLETGGYFYLASPFWHDLQKIRVKRYRTAKETAIVLNRRGYCLISGVQTIVDVHRVDIFDLTMEESASWIERSLVYLRSATALFILYSIDEVLWYNSAGCKKEFALAYDRAMPICFVDPRDYSIRRLTPAEREKLYGTLILR